MKNQCWEVHGVHESKLLSDLPVSYLLWFVGSPIMRRTRWQKCQIALREISRRLAQGTSVVEADLIAGLQQKSAAERLAIKTRRISYRASR